MQALLECIAATEFAQNDFVCSPAYIFRTHDLVGITRLEHPVLVNAAGVGKGIGAHHGLVGLHHKARGLTHHATGSQDVFGVNVQFEIKIIAACLDGHDHLFERAVASALAQTVDGALHLACAAYFHAGK